MKTFDFASKQTQVLQSGLSVIEASAGTGKTYAISHLLPRLLLDGTVQSVDRILLVTYTKAAAGELAERVRKVLERLVEPPAPDEATHHEGTHRLRELYGQEKISSVIGQALLDIDRLTVSTIHSFCQRTLQTEGALCGLPALPEVITSVEDLIETALHHEWDHRIAVNSLAGPIAVSQSWDPKDDRKFLNEALGVDTPVLIPAPKGFDTVLGEIRDRRADFPVNETKEIAAALKKVKHWNSKAPAEPQLKTFLDALDNIGTAGDFDFITAVIQIPLIHSDSWVKKSGKVAKKANQPALDSLERLLPPIIEKVSKIKGLFPILRWEFQCEVINRVQSAVSKRLAESREITFDGLVEAVLLALRNEHSGTILADRLRSRYEVALIDESQDTDPRQFEIFSRVFLEGGAEGKSRMVMIGDPKQAIYGFRGADVNTYLEAKSRAVEIFSLTKTFRAPASLVHATNTFFTRPDSFLKEGLEFIPTVSGLTHDEVLHLDGKPLEGRLEAWIEPDHPNERDLKAANAHIAGQVADEIVRILNSKPTLRSSKPGVVEKAVRPKDFAVLVYNRWQAMEVHKALTDRHVPAVRAAGDDVMASDEAGELLTILNALDDPRREGLRRAALATRLLGYDHARLFDEGGGDAVLEMFVSWNEAILSRGIAHVFALIDDKMSVVSRLAAMEGGERRITNLRHLVDLLQGVYVEHGSQFEQMHRWYAQEVGKADERTLVDERQLQLESDADSVRIITMHTAKGLEFPLVFCPFLWNARKIDGIRKANIPFRENLPEGEPEKGTYLVETSLPSNDQSAWIPRIRILELEENLRLAYVALTRAQVRVWIYGGMVTKNPQPESALDWLLRYDQSGSDAVGTRHRTGIDVLKRMCTDDSAIVFSDPPAVQASPAKWRSADAIVPHHLEAQEARLITGEWGMSSFSSITREKNAHAPNESAPSRSLMEPPVAPRILNPFAKSPGGTLVGTAVHGWIENWDFTPFEIGALEKYLSSYPFASKETQEGVSFIQQMGAMLEELRSSRLDGMDCPISEACPRPEASEWHFHLPMRKGFGASALAGVFGKHGMKEYAKSLRELPAENLNGYLHGFLDRIALHRNSWGVIDWKTNRLPNENYEPAALGECVRQSHYLLQAHLYLIALRRRLGPDAAIAGAWVVFLRGIRSGTSEGIFHVNPDPSLMRDLDDLFEKPSTACQQ